MEILHKIGLARKSELEELKENYDKQLGKEKEKIKEEHRKKIKDLEQKHINDTRKHIELEHEYEDKIYYQEELIQAKNKEILRLKNSNGGYKGNINRLKHENEILKTKIKELNSDRYLKRKLPADKTKSRNIHEGIQRPVMIHK